MRRCAFARLRSRSKASCGGKDRPWRSAAGLSRHDQSSKFQRRHYAVGEETCFTNGVLICGAYGRWPI